METFTTNGGLNSVSTGDNTQQPGHLFRPWTGTEDRTGAHTASNSLHGNLSSAQLPKPPQVIHPVKLFWPKKRCFDYLYQDAEMLLRNYPVQATICPYADSSSDEGSDDEEEEEEDMVQKELN